MQVYLLAISIAINLFLAAFTRDIKNDLQHKVTKGKDILYSEGSGVNIYSCQLKGKLNL